MLIDGVEMLQATRARAARKLRLGIIAFVTALLTLRHCSNNTLFATDVEPHLGLTHNVSVRPVSCDV